jgi:hypothetical protein
MSTKIAGYYAEISADTSKFQQGMNASQQQLGAFGGGLKSSLLQMAGWAGGVALATGALKMLAEAGKKALDSAAEAQDAQISLDATIQSMGLSAETSAGQIGLLASSMSAANGIFGDESLQKAAQSFLKIEGFNPSNLQELLKTVQDFAAGSGQDAATAADAIAMALETGQTRSLHFSAALRTQISDMIAAGDQAGALTVIMDTLNSKYGGQAEAQLHTYTGSTKALKDAVSEFWEAVGAGLVGPGESFNEWMTKNVQGTTKTIQYQNLEKEAIDRANYSLGIRVANMTAAEYTQEMANNTYANFVEIIKAELQPERQVADARAEAAMNARFAAAAEWELAEARQSQIDTTGTLGNEYQALTAYGQGWMSSQEAIKAKEAEITDARARGYLDTGAKISGLKGELADLQEAQNQQTAQWMLNVMTQQMGVDGLSSIEMEFLLDYQVQTGLLDEEGKQRAIDAWDSASKITKAIDSIPKYYTVTGYINMLEQTTRIGANGKIIPYEQKAGGGALHLGTGYTEVGEQGAEGISPSGVVIPHNIWIQMKASGMMPGKHLAGGGIPSRYREDVKPGLGSGIPTWRPPTNLYPVQQFVPGSLQAGNMNGFVPYGPAETGTPTGSTSNKSTSQTTAATTAMASVVTKAVTQAAAAQQSVSQASVKIADSGERTAQATNSGTAQNAAGQKAMQLELQAIKSLLERNLQGMPKQWAQAAARNL